MSETDPAPDNRATLLRNILGFLAPGANGLGTLTLDSSAYTIPSHVTIELGDSDLAGQGQTTATFYGTTATNHQTATLFETVRPGVFRGFFTLVGATNAAVAGQLRVRDGDTVAVEFLDTSANRIVRAEAVVDTVPPAITNIVVTPDYESAEVSWDTSKASDTLVDLSGDTDAPAAALHLGRVAADLAGVPTRLVHAVPRRGDRPLAERGRVHGGDHPRRPAVGRSRAGGRRPRARADAPPDPAARDRPAGGAGGDPADRQRVHHAAEADEPRVGDLPARASHRVAGPRDVRLQLRGGVLAAECVGQQPEWRCYRLRRVVSRQPGDRSDRRQRGRAAFLAKL